MARIFITHPVADFEKWRPYFDADKPRRTAAGLTDVAVLRDVDDPGSVWIVFEGEAAVAEAMLKDPELAGLTQQAGVTGPARFWVA